MIVTLYTSPDCGLCGKAEGALRRLQAKISFEVVCVNINDDDSLFRRYWDRIPVIEADGREIAAAPIEEKQLALVLGKRNTGL